VVITTPGDADVLQIQDVDDPQLNDDEVLIKVSAAGLNRSDISQRLGQYPPPKGAQPYPGVECSGVIEAVGKDVQKWEVGDEVHGGSSGIGTFAIQIAKYCGARVFVTAGSKEKLARCKELGADVAINYKTEDFVERVKEETGGKGVDVILDNMGGPYLQRNLDALGLDGRLFVIGFQGGFITEINLSTIFGKRLTIQAAGLRTRSVENKEQIIADVQKHIWPAFEEGKVKPIIHTTLPLSQAAEAHRIMESNTHTGKILLIV